MNRVILVEAKSRKHFDEFMEDIDDLIPYIEKELERMVERGDGFTKQAVAYRRFLTSVKNWCEPKKER